MREAGEHRRPEVGKNEMRFELRMPDLATTAAEIRIVRWRIEQGRGSSAAEPLLEVETDQAA